ncbi:hypothetical protein VOLCADRAFT_98497 [Volvox carteri f. nagariensis]|uniref:Uncharacterized protein n=1 Tax=Volvox carteri f. nagariensis TaxID=3068 RepID=D8UFH7_VOLCA|nr:uncharacterized protein VOLCADRAFT_98497 [Volvox carteri f. nagariensis]EFJ41461.1 hypothetical protein VOLCADRAFT_98497 [Volvox carteri f. nagariensis]|eukprot:XP_002957406.1 hypothetical protein VOLCADRAFT_98497 [Volvox carteri f. nagariensis]
MEPCPDATTDTHNTTDPRGTEPATGCDTECGKSSAALEGFDAQRLLTEEQAAEDLQDDDGDAGPKDWQRFYMGYHQRFVEDCVLELQGGLLRVSLAQAPSAKVAAKRTAEGRNGKGQQHHHKQQLDKASDPALTGTTVWDGAVVLSHYLTETTVLVRPADRPYAYSGGRLPNVLELGAGTGAVSLAVAVCRIAASITITDLPDLLPHLRLNVARNSGLLRPGQVHLQPLRWGPEGEQDVQSLGPVRPPYDVIVGSDLIYYSYTPETPHSRLLLWTLRRLCGPCSVVYLSLSLHHNPEEVERFLSWAAEGDDGFHVLRLRASIPVQWRVPDVLVARLTPKWTTAAPPPSANGCAVGSNDDDVEGCEAGPVAAMAATPDGAGHCCSREVTA